MMQKAAVFAQRRWVATTTTPTECPCPLGELSTGKSVHIHPPNLRWAHAHHSTISSYMPFPCRHLAHPLLTPPFLSTCSLEHTSLICIFYVLFPVISFPFLSLEPSQDLSSPSASLFSCSRDKAVYPFCYLTFLRPLPAAFPPSQPLPRLDLPSHLQPLPPLHLPSVHQFSVLHNSVVLSHRLICCLFITVPYHPFRHLCPSLLRRFPVLSLRFLNHTKPFAIACNCLIRPVFIQNPTGPTRSSTETLTCPPSRQERPRVSRQSSCLDDEGRNGSDWLCVFRKCVFSSVFMSTRLSLYT